MIGISIIGLVAILGFVSNHFLGINYLKGLRGEKPKTPTWVLIFSSLVFGSPVILLHYCLFKEVRDEDKEHHYMLLISEILILVVEVLILTLLGVYGIIKLDLVPQTSVDPSPEIAALLSIY